MQLQVQHQSDLRVRNNNQFLNTDLLQEPKSFHHVQIGTSIRKGLQQPELPVPLGLPAAASSQTLSNCFLLLQVVLSALFAAAVAAPSVGYHGYAPALASVHTSIPVTTYKKEIYPGNTLVEVQPRVAVVEQPYVAKVGEHVHRVPTAVSHQSSTIVHNSADIVTPILAKGVSKHVVPAEPIVRTYQTPSIVKTIAEPSAIHLSHTAPIAYGAYAHGAYTHGAYSHAAPLSYSHGYALPSAYYGAHAYNNYW